VQVLAAQFAFLVFTCGFEPPTTVAVQRAWSDALMPLGGERAHFCGGDGAASCPLPGDRTLWLFGDSWIARIENGRYGPGAAMVNNVAAVHTNPPRGEAPEPGAVKAYFGPPPKPGAMSGFVMPGEPERNVEPAGRTPERWCWPCDGAVLIGEAPAQKLVIFYADLSRRVEDPKPDDVWNFRFVGNRIAVIDNPADAPDAWRMKQHELTPRHAPGGAPTISWGVAAIRDAGSDREPELIVFGVDGSNTWDKLAMMARVPESKVQDFGAWRFRTGDTGGADGKPEWSTNEADAKPVMHNIVDEFTIHRQEIEGRERWVLIQGEPMLGHRVLVRFAERLEGPWSDGQAIYTIPEPGADKNLITYGAKAHPRLSAPGELLVSYCINSLDFGQMTRDVEIYRPRFVHVPEATIVQAHRASRQAVP